MKLISTILIVLSLTSCTLTISPDGTRTWGLDANTAAEIIIEAAK